MEKLREQYSLLNNRVKNSGTIEIQKSIDFIKKELPKFKNRNRIYLVLAAIFMLAYGVIYTKCGCAVGYVLAVEIFLFISAVLCYFCIMAIKQIDFNTNPLAVVDDLRRVVFAVRKIYRYFFLVTYVTVLIWIYLTYRQFNVISPEYQNLFICTFALNALGLILTSVRFYRIEKYTSKLHDELMVLKGLYILF